MVMEESNKLIGSANMGHCVASKPLSVVNTALD